MGFRLFSDLTKRVSALTNVRVRGKIPHEEWPKIAQRFQSGETLTEIARSYHCTAPAIRYIVRRVPINGGRAKMQRERSAKIAVLAPPGDPRRGARFSDFEDRSRSPRGRLGNSLNYPANDIWQRVNTDIATFLAAMDSLSADNSEDNYEALLAAADRLLWASARTRLEVERALDDRRKGVAVRRISG